MWSKVLGVSPKIIVVAIIVYDCFLRMINCHVPAQDSSLREKTVISDLKINNNGERFHNFFDTRCLSVLNTWFTHKKCRRVT